MKQNQKFFYAINSIIIVAVLIYATSCSKDNNAEVNSSHNETFEPKKPNSIIELNQAKTYYDNYTNNSVNLLRSNKGGDFDPTRYIELPYGEFKNYINYIEHQSESVNKELETVRIYLVSKSDNDPKPEYRRKNTIFIVPTTSFGNTKKGFYIRRNGETKEAVPLKDNFEDNFPNHRTSTKSDTISLIGIDWNLVPPPTLQ